MTDDDGNPEPDDLDERIATAVQKALEGQKPKDGPKPKPDLDVTGDKNIEETMKRLVEESMVPLRESVAGIAEAVDSLKPKDDDDPSSSSKPKKPKPKPKEEPPDLPQRFSLRKFLVGADD